MRNSFSIASVLLDRPELTNVSSNSANRPQHNELVAVVRDLHHLANIVPIAPGKFVQLRSWKVTEVRHLETSETEAVHRLLVDVVPNIHAPVELSSLPNSSQTNDNRSTPTQADLTANTTLGEGWQLGYHFQDDYFNDSLRIFLGGDEDAAPTSEALTVYLPIAIGAILALVLMVAAALYSR